MKVTNVQAVVDSKKFMCAIRAEVEIPLSNITDNTHMSQQELHEYLGKHLLEQIKDIWNENIEC